MTARRATSLIEMLVVMSACTVILTISAGLIHRAMHAESATRSFFDGQRSALRLSEQFRSDVHAATAASLEDASRHDGLFLRLQLADDQTVEYRRRESNLLRFLLKKDHEIARDEFVFSSPLELSIRVEATPRRLILEITAGSVALTATKGAKQPLAAYLVPVNLQLEACLARDLPSPQPPTRGAEKNEESK